MTLHRTLTVCLKAWPMLWVPVSFLFEQNVHGLHVPIFALMAPGLGFYAIFNGGWTGSALREVTFPWLVFWSVFITIVTILRLSRQRFQFSLLMAIFVMFVVGFFIGLNLWSYQDHPLETGWPCHFIIRLSPQLIPDHGELRNKIEELQPTIDWVAVTCNVLVGFLTVICSGLLLDIVLQRKRIIRRL